MLPLLVIVLLALLVVCTVGVMLSHTALRESAVERRVQAERYLASNDDQDEDVAILLTVDACVEEIYDYLEKS